MVDHEEDQKGVNEVRPQEVVEETKAAEGYAALLKPGCAYGGVNNFNLRTKNKCTGPHLVLVDDVRGERLHFPPILHLEHGTEEPKVGEFAEGGEEDKKGKTGNFPQLPRECLKGEVNP